MSLATRLRKRRDELRLAPDIIAAAAGLTPDEYLAFEEARSVPSEEQLEWIASVVNMVPAALTGGAPRPAPSAAGQVLAPMAAPPVAAAVAVAVGEGALVVPRCLLESPGADAWSLGDVVTLVRLRAMLEARGLPVGSAERLDWAAFRRKVEPFLEPFAAFLKELEAAPKDPPTS
jgi:hypothetical protein